MTDAEVLEEIEFVLRHVDHPQVVQCLEHSAIALRRHICAEKDEAVS